VIVFLFRGNHYNQAVVFDWLPIGASLRDAKRGCWALFATNRCISRRCEKRGCWALFATNRCISIEMRVAVCSIWVYLSIF